MARPKMNREEFAGLSADVREAIEADGSLDTRAPGQGPATPEPRRGRRDEAPTAVLCISHAMPHGEVIEQQVDAYGEPVLDGEGNPTFCQRLRPVLRKERVRMPRWCAELMQDNDQVVILDT